MKNASNDASENHTSISKKPFITEEKENENVIHHLHLYVYRKPVGSTGFCC